MEGIRYGIVYLQECFKPKELIIMELRLTYRHCKSTPDLENHIRSQLAKIEDFLTKESRLPQILEFVVEMHPKHQYHIVSARLQAADHFYVAKHEGPDVFAEINEVCDRLYAQLQGRKEELVDRQKHGCDGECRAEFYEEIEEELAQDDEEE
jgi:ribosomal subunit interface protein